MTPEERAEKAERERDAEVRAMRSWRSRYDHLAGRVLFFCAVTGDGQTPEQAIETHFAAGIRALAGSAADGAPAPIRWLGDDTQDADVWELSRRPERFVMLGGPTTLYVVMDDRTRIVVPRGWWIYDWHTTHPRVSSAAPAAGCLCTESSCCGRRDGCEGSPCHVTGHPLCVACRAPEIACDYCDDSLAPAPATDITSSAQRALVDLGHNAPEDFVAALRDEESETP